ncbi:MAG: hypothetical protein PHW63_06850 [Alphaproteobacteria bacterium]|nr:hypothetical protein [Alphaproteobacteria bacterium]
MNPHDPVHLALLGKSLEDAIRHEAKTHGAYFDPARAQGILHAVCTGKIQAQFLLAAWENCAPRPIGVAIEFPTVIGMREGQDIVHYAATYGEDTCLLPEQIKALLKDRNGRPCYSGTQLGLLFEQERMRLMLEQPHPLFGAIPRGRIGEFSAHSTTMISLLNHFGADLGTPNRDAVIELDDLTPSMKSRWRVPIETQGLFAADGTPASNIFLTSWESDNGKQKIAASFTEGFSTFTSETVTRAQITSNGSLPKGDELKDVLTSLIQAGQEEIGILKWGAADDSPLTSRRSPIIPINGSGREVLQASCRSSQDELFMRPIGASDLFPIIGHKPPIMRVHTLNEPEICTALTELGLVTRTLGQHPMLPASMDFAAMPNGAVNFAISPARPLQATAKADDYGKPCFSLAA